LRLVALTFDDGPDPRYTSRVLQLLRAAGAHATFFLEGRSVRLHPELARRIVDGGNVIGNHTDTHPLLSGENRGAVRREIDDCARALQSFDRSSNRLFRPPYGSLSPIVLQEATARKLRIILWTTSLEHHDARTPAAMAARVLRQVQPGAIILMHDGGGNRESTVRALPRLLQGLRQRHFRMVTIPELLSRS
jgi:peptidoglycan/xylan/chitin deacetylase (PgdA/CDA1 family)